MIHSALIKRNFCRVDKMWQDDFNKFMQTAAASGGGGLFIAIIKGIVTRYGGFWQWLSLLAATLFVSVLVGLGLDSSGLTIKEQSAVIGLCSFLAEDILFGVLALSKLFSTDPIGTVGKVWNAIRGKSEKKDDV